MQSGVLNNCCWSLHFYTLRRPTLCVKSVLPAHVTQDVARNAACDKIMKRILRQMWEKLNIVSLYGHIYLYLYPST